MNRRRTIPLWLLLAAAPLAVAQTTATHAPAGSARQTIQSIFIPPLPNAPFSATITMEVSQMLPDGTSISHYNERVVMRDSAGRIFQERRTLVPRNGAQQPAPWRIEFSDPAAHRKYFCALQKKTCQVSAYAAPTSFQLPPAGPLPGGRGDLRRESLGTNTIEGMEAEGTRETRVLNAGAVGNDRPITFTREFWYAPRLGINVVEKRTDPDSTVTITVSHVSLAEPDSSYFAVPPGFSVAKQGGDAGLSGR